MIVTSRHQASRVYPIAPPYNSKAIITFARNLPSRDYFGTSAPSSQPHL